MDCHQKPENALFSTDCDTIEFVHFVFDTTYIGTVMTLKLNDEAPNFTANSTHGGIDFHKWIGDSWAILFSHPKTLLLFAQRSSVK